MKASDVIRMLEVAKAENGDLEVVYEAHVGTCDVDGVIVEPFYDKLKGSLGNKVIRLY